MSVLYVDASIENGKQVGLVYDRDHDEVVHRTHPHKNRKVVLALAHAWKTKQENK